MSSEPAHTSAPDTWTEHDSLDLQWYGVCHCRLRREHPMLDDSGNLTDVVARCDAGHTIDLAKIL